MIKSLFYLPIYKDWIFYYSVANLISLLSEMLDWIKDPLAGASLDTLSNLVLGYSLFLGVPLFIRYRLKIKSENFSEIVENKNNVIFVSFSTDDRLVVDKVVNELKKRTSAFYWMQNNIQGGQDGENVINEKIQMSIGSLIFFSRNSEESHFIQNIELPKITQKYLEGNSYLVLPIKVGKTTSGFVEEFKDLQTIPSKSQTIGRLTEIEFEQEINKIINSLPPNLQVKDTKRKKNDFSKILTIFGWLIAIASLSSTFLTSNQLGSIFQSVDDNFGDDNYVEYSMTGDPDYDICTLWQKDGTQQLKMWEGFFEMLDMEFDNLNAEKVYRESIVNEYAKYLYDLKSIISFYATESIEYLEVESNIDLYIKYTLEAHSSEMYYSGDSLENNTKISQLYEGQINTSTNISRFCYSKGFEVAATSLMDAEEIEDLVEGFLDD
jgi:hypothetical protein